MKKQVLSLILVAFCGVVAAQESDPVIMSINGKDIKKSEFEYIYRKNNTEEAIDKKSLDEYIQLFKNFKLKVTEAETQQLDTTESFLKELNEYREELSKPYLDNIEQNEDLIRTEYNRLKEDLEIGHILISFSGQNMDNPEGMKKEVFPVDTLEAYKKAMQIRKRLLKGEDFSKVAEEVSNDRQFINKDQPGYLGWVTGMALIPSLEDGAYSTPVGQISMPVRTNFGYHLIKVFNRQQDPGLIRASHILILCPEDADAVQAGDAKKKADELYQRASGGEDFGTLAKEYSDDKGSAKNGGDLAWFGIGQMVKEFQEAAFALKDTGDICPPVRSKFGFHIIKLLGRKPQPSFEEKKPAIIAKFQQNGTYAELVKPGMEKLKHENGFSMNSGAQKELATAANTLYPVSTDFISRFASNQSPLFIINSTTYTISQFVNFIKQDPSPTTAISTDLLNDLMTRFEYSCLLDEENKLLEKKYPDFRNLIQEYRDGILLFDIMNKEVWEKAGKDTEGLKAFFEQHKADYSWKEPHYKGYVVLCKDHKIKKKMQKEISGLAVDSAATFLLNNYRVGEVSYVRIEKGLFVKGDNPFVDEVAFKSGKATCPEGFADFFVMGKLLPQLPEDYTDVKGPVITDYQNYLEDEWIELLNKKYPIVIFPEIVSTIK